MRTGGEVRRLEQRLAAYGLYDLGGKGQPNGVPPLVESLKVFLGIMDYPCAAMILEDDGLISEYECDAFYNEPVPERDFDPEIHLKPLVQVAYARYCRRFPPGRLH